MALRLFGILCYGFYSEFVFYFIFFRTDSCEKKVGGTSDFSINVEIADFYLNPPLRCSTPIGYFDGITSDSETLLRRVDLST